MVDNVLPGVTTRILRLESRDFLAHKLLPIKLSGCWLNDEEASRERFFYVNINAMEGAWIGDFLVRRKA